MPYRAFPEVFHDPPDEHIKIWRFGDFAKFVAILERQALFFVRADRLEDQFEGSYTKPAVEARAAFAAELAAFAAEHGGVDHGDEQAAILAQQATLAALTESVRRHAFLNCWHMNDHESAGMWRLYVSSGAGIAIQSTFARLRDCFHLNQEEIVSIGTVKYLDYGGDAMSWGDSSDPFLYKRKSFAHEQELRAFVQKYPGLPGGHPVDPDSPPVNLLESESPFDGYVACDLDVLVERVYVSPASGGWFRRLVESVLARYGLSKPIVQSSLDDPALY